MLAAGPFHARCEYPRACHPGRISTIAGLALMPPVMRGRNGRRQPSIASRISFQVTLPRRVCEGPVTMQRESFLA